MSLLPEMVPSGLLIETLPMSVAIFWFLLKIMVSALIVALLILSNRLTFPWNLMFSIAIFWFFMMVLAGVRVI